MILVVVLLMFRITDNSISDEKRQLAEIYGFDDLDESKSGKTVSVICSDGDTHLGGDDVDIELYNVVLNIVRQQGYKNEPTREDRERIILELERLKKEGVNGTYVHTIKFLSTNESYRVTIGPEVFKAALEPIYQKTRSIIERVLSENVNTADTLVMVGGSTKNPQLIENLKRDYPSFYINNAFPPDESVSLGAGIHAKELKFGENAVSVFDSLALGIGILSDGKMRTIIPKNSQYPITKTKRFTNVVDNQDAIEVSILQGNTVYAEEAVSLGNLVIDGLPHAPAETLDIDVNLAINANGILTCSAIIHSLEPGGKNIERDLVLNLSKVENTTAKKLSKDEKLLIKWKKKAESLPENKAVILNEMIAGYPDKYDKKNIMDFIRSCMDITEG